MKYLIRLSIMLLSLFVISSCSKKQTDEGSGLVFTSKEILDKVNNARSPMIGGSNEPGSVDLSSKLPPPGNQGHQNSCVGWAIAYGMKSYQEKVGRNWELTQSGEINPDHVFSPAYIYNQINRGEDRGSRFQDAFNLVESKGVAPLSKAPYDETDYLSKPPDGANTEAKNYRIAWAKKIEPKDLSDVKSYLTKGYPVVLAVMYDKAFTRRDGDAVVTEMVTDVNAMGHAMLCVGFDDSKKTFKIMNSWGKDWRDGGFCYFTYDLFPKVVREAWVSKDVEGNKEIRPEDENKVDDNNPIVDEVLSDLKITKIDNSVPSAEGKVIRFTCTCRLDKNFGDKARIILFISDENGKPIRGASNDFSSGDGSLIAYSELINIESFSEQTKEFTIELPYAQFDMDMSKKNNFTATPVLFIDDFDATDGSPFKFETKAE